MAGGGASAILEMINRVRDNKSLIRKRYFDELKHSIKISAKVRGLDTHATPEQIEEIRQRHRKIRRVNIIKNLIILVISLTITYYIFFVLIA